MRSVGKSFVSLPTHFSIWRAGSCSRPLAKPRNLFYSVRTALSVAIASAALLVLQSAQANNTWDGGSGVDSLWGTVANWGSDTLPGYGTLTFAGTTRTSNTDNSITAMNQLNWTGSSAWTVGTTNSTTLSLFDFGGTQAKIENNTGGAGFLVTINLPITFAANNASPPNPFGEINAVTGDITFANGGANGSGTLTVNGSSVNGIKLFGGGHVVT